MAWRNLHISSSCNLTLKRGSLILEYWQGEDKSDKDRELVSLPLEDIAVIVFDTRQYQISGPLLSACVDRGIVLVMSDEKHMPCGVALPFHQHHKQAQVAWMQVAVSDALNRRLWRRIVQAKIANQAAVLDSAGKHQQAKPLWAMSKRKAKIDFSHLEAQAARAYWQSLFSDFARSDEKDSRNALLNYGYAIVRSCISRAIVGVGLLPAFGLHHRSQSNNFNLADDIIEPFRPLVDSMVHGRMDTAERKGEDGITLADRQYMVGVMGQQVRIDDSTMPLLPAIERVLETLVAAMKSGKPNMLILPEVR